MFDNLTDHLQGALKTIRGDAKLTADNIEEAIHEVRKALLEADVSYTETYIRRNLASVAAVGIPPGFPGGVKLPVHVLSFAEFVEAFLP